MKNEGLSHHWTLQSSEGAGGVFTIVDRMNSVVGTVEFWGGPEGESARTNAAAIEEAPAMVRLLRDYLETGAMNAEHVRRIIAHVDAQEAPHIDTLEEIHQRVDEEFAAARWASGEGKDDV
jgi:hypothetical protein